MLPTPIKRFIEIFAKLPGIGPRQAGRIAFWLIKKRSNELDALQESLANLRENIKICRNCSFVYEDSDESGGLCNICRDPKRDATILAVVEKETDLVTIEKTKKFHGLYHVLGGTMSPLRDKQENQLTIRALQERLEKNQPHFQEVILALSPTTAGDYTATEIEKILKPSGIKITRLGRGLPRGSEVEFADEDTISSAIEGRK